MNQNNQLIELYESLFKRGLGDLPLMLHQEGRVLLGNLVMDKGKLVFRDLGMLKDTPSNNVAPCFDLGIIGAIADIRGEEWSSLSYIGPDNCQIAVDLSSTRQRVLGGLMGSNGENLLNYYGSVYRGFQMLLDSNLLPVILPVPLRTKKGEMGLAVTDFRFATVALTVVSEVYDLVRVCVDRKLTFSVEEVMVDDSEFENMFGSFTK